MDAKIAVIAPNTRRALLISAPPFDTAASAWRRRFPILHTEIPICGPRHLSQFGPFSYHNRIAGDTNAHSHLQAAIVGPSETAPVKDGHLVTGTWQQFVLVDFDDHPRDRTIMVQVLS
jgi:hypothetical protein